MRGSGWSVFLLLNVLAMSMPGDAWHGLFSLPHLLHHYQHHRHDGDQDSFMTSLTRHYAANAHARDHHHHEDLPFHHHQDQPTPVSQPSWATASVSLPPVITPAADDDRQLPKHQPGRLSRLAADLWQPPRPVAFQA